MQHFLASRQTRDIPIKHLYVEYRHWIETTHPFPTVTAELSALARQGRHFKRIVSPEAHDVVFELCTFLETFDIRTSYPLLLATLEADVPDEQLKGISTVLESYLFRRAACNLTTKNYNKIFLTLTMKLRKGGFEAESLDKWCAMMYPRLKLLQELLSENGTFWMTVDDNELHHAREILDEVFGAGRFISCVVWQKRTSPESRLRLGAAHDYVLVYGNGFARGGLRRLSLTDEQEAEFENPDEDPRGEWTSTDFTAQGFRPNQMYEITTPSGAKYTPPEGRCWGTIESEFLRLKEEGRMWFGVNGDARPRIKTYLEESEGVSAWTWWTNSEVGGNQESKKEVMRILGPGNTFDYPKPVRLLSRIIELATDSGSLILDSFAGSGTTAHAALLANVKDGGSRRFILVEEEEYANHITAERVRKVITGYSFTGTEKEELFRHAITWKTLNKAEPLLKKVSQIESENVNRFDKIKKSVKGGELVVTGEKKVTERTEGLGGEFTYCTLGPELDVDKILTGETLPDYLSVGAWLFHTATGDAFNATEAKAKDWYLGESAAYHVWLVYRADLKFLKSADAALTLALAEKIAKTKPAGKKHLVFAPAKYVPNSKLLPMGVEYAPLPFALYRIERG